MIKNAPRHNGFWRVWNWAKKSGKFLYKNLPIYKEKTWLKWSSVDLHCSLVSHSSKHRFKWKNWLLSMPFCLILSNLPAILIANCNIWLENKQLTEIWPKQKKSRKVSTRDQTGDLLHVRQMWYSLHHENFIWRELAYKYINHFMYMYFYVFNFRNACSIAKAQKQLFLFNFFAMF